MQTAGLHKRSGENKVETIPLAAITSEGPRESVTVSDPIDTNPESEGDDDTFPDGGLRAWLVVLGVSKPLKSNLLIDQTRFYSGIPASLFEVRDLFFFWSI